MPEQFIDERMNMDEINKLSKVLHERGYIVGMEDTGRTFRAGEKITIVRYSKVRIPCSVIVLRETDRKDWIAHRLALGVDTEVETTAVCRYWRVRFGVDAPGE